MKFALILSLSGLASCCVFRPVTQDVVVRCNEPGARLFVGDRELGLGSAVASLERNHAHVFRATMEDGRTATETVTPAPSSMAALDAIGGVLFIVPAIGLLSPGAYDLSRTDVVIMLPPAPGEPWKPAPPPIVPPQASPRVEVESVSNVVPYRYD